MADRVLILLVDNVKNISTTKNTKGTKENLEGKTAGCGLWRRKKAQKAHQTAKDQATPFVFFRAFRGEKGFDFAGG